jgi:hypothetical protein
MKERPIIFNGEMVRAILAGRKTQTRRVIKVDGEHLRYSTYGKQALEILCDGTWRYWTHVHGNPYGQPGDRLWVREAWAYWGSFPDDGWVIYRADADKYGVTWKPSIYMPKKYARIWLDIAAVRVERVQDITEEDVLAEGCGLVPWSSEHDWPRTAGFAELWDGINKKRGFGWDVNPWVWVVEFAPC